MRAVFVCYSGTGNTRRVCEALMGELAARGHEAELVPLIRGEALPPLTAERIVFAFPVHAFRAPAPVLAAIGALPPSAGRTVFFVRTSGEPLALNHAAVLAPRRILQKKGYRVAGDLHYVMPYNIIFRHTDGMAARMWETVVRRLPADAAAIEAGSGRLPRVGLFGRAAALAVRIEQPAMPLIGRGFSVSEDCVGCGACVARCPERNIRMEGGKPVFGGHCTGCMACAFFCPRDAVRTGILNGWRVNGAYDLTAPPAEDKEVCRYCRKSYLRYFHSYE